MITERNCWWIVTINRKSYFYYWFKGHFWPQMFWDLNSQLNQLIYRVSNKIYLVMAAFETLLHEAWKPLQICCFKSVVRSMYRNGKVAQLQITGLRYFITVSKHFEYSVVLHEFHNPSWNTWILNYKYTFITKTDIKVRRK